MSVPSSPPPPPDGPGAGPHEAPTRVARAVPVATAPAPVVDPAGPVARDADVAAAFERSSEALRSIRTMLAIVGVVAVAALGLAVWALLRKPDVNNSGSRRGLASQADLAAANGRIDHLSGELSGLRGVAGAGASAAGSVSARLGALEQQVKQLDARPNPATQTSTLQSLSSRIDKVAADVAQLKANPQTQTQTQTTTTTS